MPGNLTGVIDGSLVLLVGSVLLFVDNDQAEVLQRREYGGASSDHDSRFSGSNAMPLIESLAGRHRAVHEGYLIRKMRRGNAREQRGKPDLRHHEDRRVTLPEHFRDQLQIDLRLPASGHAMNQVSRGHAPRQPRAQLVEDLLLGCSEIMGGRRRRLRYVHGNPEKLERRDLRQAFALQSLSHRSRGPRRAQRFFQGNRLPSGFQEGVKRALKGRQAFEILSCRRKRADAEPFLLAHARPLQLLLDCDPPLLRQRTQPAGRIPARRPCRESCGSVKGPSCERVFRMELA